MRSTSAASPSGFTNLLGAGVHWVDFGGPVRPAALCVLVHGLGGSTVNWESLVPHLIDRFHCVALDLVGFGLTEPGRRSARVGDNCDLVAAFVQQARRDHRGVPVVLIGNSMGGLISAQFAAARPEQVAGVVLVDPTVPPARFLPGPGGILAAGLYAVPAVGQVAARARRSLRTPAQNVQDTLRLCTVDPGGIDSEVVAHHLPVAQRRCTHPEMDRHYSDAARSILATLAHRAETDRMYSSVQSPVLLVHGTRDRLVPFSGGLRVAARNPRWRFAPASNCGHLPMLEEPHWLAAQIAAWWDARVM